MINTLAYQRGRAAGLLLYPRPDLTRGMADSLNLMLHCLFGKPETDAEHTAFIAGYAHGQRIMEEAMEQPTPPQDTEIPPAAVPYVDRLAIMLAEANQHAKAYKAAYHALVQFSARMVDDQPDEQLRDVYRAQYREIYQQLYKDLPPTTATMPHEEPAHVAS